MKKPRLHFCASGFCPTRNPGCQGRAISLFPRTTQNDQYLLVLCFVFQRSYLLDDKRRLFALDSNFRSCGYLLKYRGVADDSAKYDHRARRANFASLTYRGGAEEDAKRIAVRPVTQVAYIYHFLSGLQLKAERDREVYFVSQEIDTAFAVPCLPDCLSRLGIV